MIPRTIVFAGGGTAGHIEPALAIAQGWKSLHPLDQEIFLGTIHGLENTLVPAAGFRLCHIPKVVMPRKLGLGLLTSPWKFYKALGATRTAIAGTDLLIGFGGYVAAPAYVAARLEKIPIVIHEANAKVGWANRLGSLFTHNLATAHQINRGSFASARVTGLPLKMSILSAVEEASQNWEKSRRLAKISLGWSPEQPTLLVLGGSQGSAFINGVMADALVWLVEEGVQIHHSVGVKNKLPEKRENYLPVAYIEDVATALLAADIVVARSGAVTCAEFGALGRYGLFIPLPIGNGEQAKNAESLIAAQRARVILQENFSAHWLVNNFYEILSASKATDPSALPNDLHAIHELLVLMQSSMKKATK